MQMERYMNPQTSVTLAFAITAKPYVQIIPAMQRLVSKHVPMRVKHTRKEKVLNPVMDVIRVDV